MNKKNREILRLSVPAIVSNITVPLLGLCDTGISGHLGSEIYLAAIAVGSVMLNVVFWLFGFLRMGTTGLTATAYGAGDDREVTRVFSRSFLLAFLSGVVLIIFREPLMELLLHIVDADRVVEKSVRSYFIIRIWGAPALLSVMAISGWFVGMQSTFWPMLIAITVNVINIVASFCLVYPAGAGFDGVAWGTLISNWIGLGLALACVRILRKGKPVWCGIGGLFRKSELVRFFSVNADLFIRSACIICVTMGVTAAGARLGALTLAVNVVVMQFFQFFSFFMDGFAFSAEALTGRCAGAADGVGLRSYYRLLLRWSVAVALTFCILYLVGNGFVAALLTDSENVRRGVEGLAVVIALIPVVSVWAFIYDGFYVGITDTRRMMWATIAATAVFFIVAFLRVGKDGILIEVESNRVVWIAFLSYLLMRGIVLIALWPASLRHRLYGKGK